MNIKRILKSTAGILILLLAVIPAIGAFTGCIAGVVTAVEPVVGPIIDGAEAYHVIVVGGEPEGVAAALAAARNGMKTLLLERGDCLGGLMTLGMLNFLDMNHGPGNELLTRGVFKEFNDALGNAFDIEEAKAWFMRKCEAEPNLTVSLDTRFVSPLMEGDSITGVKVSRGGTEESIRSLIVIDATTDADVAAASGVPYTTGGEDYGAVDTLQGVTLVFEVAGVDWNRVTNYLRNDGNAGTGADGVAAWGYGAEAMKYKPTDAGMRYRGPNMARQKDGNVLLNALIIFGVDALDPESYARGIERGLSEIPHIVKFMQENFVGFENASFTDAAERLYVRETRHIQGEYRLTITDVLENRDHWDRIGHGSYPVDIQPTSPDNYGNVIGAPDIYSIPFRCLVPLKVEGLLVAGRSASYDSIPHGSARVIPIGMVAGEACGTAASQAISEGVTVRELSADVDAVKRLQSQLIKQGAYLKQYDPPRMKVMDHWAYSGVVVMRELGLTEGGYNNDYRLENELPNRWALQNKFNKMMSLVHARTEVKGHRQIPFYEVNLADDHITLGEVYLTAAAGAMLYTDENPAPDEESGYHMEDIEQAIAYLQRCGILEKELMSHFPDNNAVANYGQLLYLLGRLYTYLMS